MSMYQGNNSNFKSIPVDVDEYRILCQFCMELITYSLENDKWLDYPILIECLKKHNPETCGLPFKGVG